MGWFAGNACENLGDAGLDLPEADVAGQERAHRLLVGGVHHRGHGADRAGLANAFAAVQVGVRTLDASLGGIGGCPFAPAATGNIPTEDLIYMLHRSGYDTGISLGAAIETGKWLQERLGRPVPGMLVKAGAFPRPAVPS